MSSGWLAWEHGFFLYLWKGARRIILLDESANNHHFVHTTQRLFFFVKGQYQTELSRQRVDYTTQKQTFSTHCRETDRTGTMQRRIKRKGAANESSSQSRTTRGGTSKSRALFQNRFHIAVVTVVSTALFMTWTLHTSADSEGQFLRKQLPSLNGNPPGTCIADPSQLPPSWRAPEGLVSEESGRPWTTEEQELAYEAIDKGLDEIINFYDHISEKRIINLGVDGVNSLIDEVYASENLPAFHQKALLASSKIIKISTQKYAASETYKEGCTRTYNQMKFCAYADYLARRLPEDEELHRLRDTLVKRTNAMFRACKDIDGVLGYLGHENDFLTELANKDAHRDLVFRWVLAAIALVDAMTVPELEMPPGSDEFVAGVWEYFKDYKLPYARDNERGMRDHVTFDVAYTATHIAYIPTGYGRHAQLVEDAPYLFKYTRENFYAVLDRGVLDLVSEFVDILRQYGCTEENDVQVRHGSRYLLNLYKESGHSWMKRRESFDRKKISDYMLIHKPWTGISGVEPRQVEPMVPGSYGHAFTEALERAAAA